MADKKKTSEGPVKKTAAQPQDRGGNRGGNRKGRGGNRGGNRKK